MAQSICLNADIGELPGDVGRALDRAILDIVSRCSIACGGHAGDEHSIRSALKAARARNVLAGVHPSYPDPENFGRLSLDISSDDLLASLRQQIRRFSSIARDMGVVIAHLKPHGALYNDAARNRPLADLVVEVTCEACIPLLVGPPDSELSHAAKEQGLKFLAEGFADRRYQADGTLTPRTHEGAMIETLDAQVQQVMGIVQYQRAFTSKNVPVDLHVETICLHSDTPGAVRSALALRDALQSNGIEISASPP